MKISWKMWLIIIGVSIITPIIIGWGVSQDILNDWTNDNDWIGFWGSYVGTIIGSGMTLLVLWSTLEDNKHAREREENINYYNNLIEIISTLFVDIGNYFTLVIRLLGERDIETYNLCIEAGNKAAKSGMIFDAYVYIKKEVDNIDRMQKDIRPIEDEVDKIGSQINNLMRNEFSDQQEIDILYNKMQDIIKQLNDYTKIFPKLIKEELDK